MDELSPRFIRHTEAEAVLHPSYVLVSTVRCSATKGSFRTTIEWHTRGGPAADTPAASAPGRRGAPAVAAPAAPVTPMGTGPNAAAERLTHGGARPRVRILAEREPLNAEQAREKAEALARRYGVPVVLMAAS